MVWIEMADGMMRVPRGEIISQDDFEALSHGLGTVILPDNGRDPIGRGGLRLAISKDDAQL
jgi:hypothetical protein